MHKLKAFYTDKYRAHAEQMIRDFDPDYVIGEVWPQYDKSFLVVLPPIPADKYLLVTTTNEIALLGGSLAGAPLIFGPECSKTKVEVKLLSNSVNVITVKEGDIIAKGIYIDKHEGE